LEPGYLRAPVLDAGRAGGIGPILLSTAFIVGVCLTTSVPVGLGAAVFLSEVTARSRLPASSVEAWMCWPACRPSSSGSSATSSSVGLAVRYGSETALEGVDLEVDEGSIQAIVGPSGCGKSSLLMALNRLTDLVPGARVEGSVRIGDQQVLAGDTDVRGLRRRVGRERAMESALRAVGLWDEVAHRLVEPALTLSGGQQQRLCIARALVLEPDVLLMDEPCSALDPISSGVVEECIEGLRGRYTVVIVTHNLAQARRIADRTALLWRVDGAGRLVEEACTRQFFEEPGHRLTRAYVEGRSG